MISNDDSNQKISVRYAEHEEAEVIRSIIDIAFESVRAIYRPRPDSVSTEADPALETQSILAVFDDIAIGAASIHSDCGSLRVSQISVLPEYRGIGVCRSLLCFAQDAARDLGISQLSLNTIEETGNVVIFERLGFSITKRSTATWCVSDRFDHLTDVELARYL